VSALGTGTDRPDAPVELAIERVEFFPCLDAPGCRYSLPAAMLLALNASLEREVSDALDGAILKQLVPDADSGSEGLRQGSREALRPEAFNALCWFTDGLVQASYASCDSWPSRPTREWKNNSAIATPLARHARRRGERQRY
jgi:hypothetical protein